MINSWNTWRQWSQMVCPMIARSHSTAAEEASRLSAPALRTFLRIADLWELSVAEQMTLLGVTDRPTFLKWHEDPNVVLPRDTLERISCVLGIHKALQALLPEEGRPTPG